MIKAILACDCAGGIAKNGSMPWPKNEKDLAWFKRNTMKCTVIMGRKTWLDPQMPSPLPGRKNIVVTSDPTSCPGADEYITENLLENIQKIHDDNYRHDIWIIGGARLLEQTMPIVEQLYLTIMPDDYHCDTVIPLKDILRTMDEIGHKEVDGMQIKILERFKGL